LILLALFIVYQLYHTFVNGLFEKKEKYFYSGPANGKTLPHTAVTFFQ